jgi:hypothetical protein
MPEILSVRLSNSENPTRDKDFSDALKKSGATETNVVRELVDAYVRFVKKHKRLPTFPLGIIEENRKEK